MHLSEVTSYKIHTLRGCKTYSSLYSYTPTAPHFCHYAPLKITLSRSMQYLSILMLKNCHMDLFTIVMILMDYTPLLSTKPENKFSPAKADIIDKFFQYFVQWWPICLLIYLFSLVFMCCQPEWYFFWTFKLSFFKFFKIKFRYEKW